MCAQDVQTHTYITNCNSIKVKYLLHRISHHKVNTKFARRQYYYKHSGITSPTTTGTPTGERLPSSPERPPETLRIHYLSPIRDFHWMKSKCKLTMLSKYIKGIYEAQKARHGLTAVRNF